MSLTRARKGNLGVFVGGALLAALLTLLAAESALAAEPPVAAYSFDAASGAVAGDVAGTHDGMIAGPTWTEGKYGTALRFDGQAEEDCVTVPDSPELRFSGNFTVDAWIRPEGSLYGDTILFKEYEAESGPTFYFAVGFNAKGKLQGSILESEEPETSQTVVASKALPEFKWSHVAFTFDGSKQRLYLNGELVGTHAASIGAVSSTGPLQIGCAKGWESDYFWGKIDELRIYNRALSVGEVENDRDNAIQTPPSKAPVASYSFDAGEGEVAEDLSRAHDGAIEGAKWTEGRFGSALYFDGSSSCVKIPDAVDLQLGEEFTLESWVRPSGTQTFAPIFYKEREGFYSYSIFLGVFGNGQPEGFVANESPGWSEVVAEEEALSDKKWSHIAFTSDGTKLRLYVNGELVETANARAVGESEGPLYLGCFPNSEEYFRGRIDEVRIYNRRLSAGEIETDRDSPIQTPTRTEPVAAYTVDEGEGTVANDLAGPHDGTVEGAGWSEGKYGAALEFDGEADCLTVPDRFDLHLQEAFTLETWVKPSATDGSGPIIYKESGGFVSYGLVLGIEPGSDYVPEGALGFDPSETTRVAGEPIPDEAWSHVAVTYDGEDFRLYVNSELMDVQESASALFSTGALRIGCAINREEFFGGRIDEVRLYNRALPAGEIESDSKDDHVAPTIELSGPLTEGLKEGTSKYSLKAHAVDGVIGRPGVGLGKVTIAVNGELVDSAEQECPAGNCTLDREWTFDKEKFSGDDWQIEVSANDVAGNQSSRSLLVTPPEGAIPACSPLDGSAPESTPSETKSLAGGGTLYIYNGANGEKYEFPEGPSGFNPLTASNEELRLYGYPRRPSKVADLEAWEAVMERVGPSAPPGGCVSAIRPSALEPATEQGTNLVPYQSGYQAIAVKGSNRWVGAHATYHQPATKNKKPQCRAEASLSSWVALGAGESGFFQAGTTTDLGGQQPYPFMEKFLANNPKFEKSERQYRPNFKVEPGNEIYAQVEWIPATEQALMFVSNLTTHKHKALYSRKGLNIYSGDFAEIIGAERNSKIATNETEFIPSDLWNFGNIRMTEAKLQLAAGGEETLRETNRAFDTNLIKFVMQRKNGTGNIMSRTTELGADGMSFGNNWNACHP